MDYLIGTKTMVTMGTMAATKSSMEVMMTTINISGVGRLARSHIRLRFKPNRKPAPVVVVWQYRLMPGFVPSAVQPSNDHCFVQDAGKRLLKAQNSAKVADKLWGSFG